jgi:hypothetical protein
VTNSKISRRGLIGAAAAAGLAGFPTARADDGGNLLFGNDADTFAASFSNSYLFLDAMMDAYAQGSTLRLIQSYVDQQGLLTTGFTYDNAEVINAYLARGGAQDIARARVLGDSLLYAQQHDPNFNDGRLRQAYFVDLPDANHAFIRLALAPFFFLGSAVGDLAWAGIALTQLYARTRNRAYLDGAVQLGTWIFNNTFDTRGAGGYNFGVDGGNNKLLFKATEHNIDTYAFFTMLARFTVGGPWSSRAQHARTFVEAMWNPAGKFFWTGTGTDGVAINKDNIPEDVQTWSFMALKAAQFAASIDWAKTNLTTTDTPQTINSRLTGLLRFQGATFASDSLRALTPSSQFDRPPDPNAVWMEGTAHLAEALILRGLPREQDLEGFTGDLDTARGLLDNIRVAQDKLGAGQTVGGKALPDGQGVVAASSVLNTGFGNSYYPNRHIGATAWYLIAGQLANPLQLGFRLTQD